MRRPARPAQRAKPFGSALCRAAGCERVHQSRRRREHGHIAPSASARTASWRRRAANFFSDAPCNSASENRPQRRRHRSTTGSSRICAGPRARHSAPSPSGALFRGDAVCRACTNRGVGEGVNRFSSEKKRSPSRKRVSRLGRSVLVGISADPFSYSLSVPASDSWPQRRRHGSAAGSSRICAGPRARHSAPSPSGALFSGDAVCRACTNRGVGEGVNRFSAKKKKKN